jgi:hypothetical protein
MDLSFDAKQVVFSAKLEDGDTYHLYLLTLDSGEIQPLTDGPQDDLYPVFVPGGRIFFLTNEVRNPGEKVHKDEYERGEAIQPATVSIGTDGSVSDRQLGAFNLSHYSSPSMLADGRIALTSWQHLGDVNEGKLFALNPDMTGLRAIAGKHQGMTNSYHGARQDDDDPGVMYAVGTSRDRTFQAGKLVKVTLNGNEEDATVEDLTPSVPGDREPSPANVGRYKNPYAVGGLILTAWASGPVQSEQNSAAQQPPDFGIYLFNPKTLKNELLYNDPSTWELQPIPLKTRAAPALMVDAARDTSADYFTIGALDVRQSSLMDKADIDQINRVRVMEGFGTEEGAMREFGLTEFEGHVLLGEFEPKSDGSFLACVPANVPVYF